MSRASSLVPLLVALAVFATSFFVEFASYRPPEEAATALRCGVTAEDFGAATPPTPTLGDFARAFEASREYLSLLALALVAGFLAYVFQQAGERRPPGDETKLAELGGAGILQKFVACRIPLALGVAIGLAEVLPVPKEVLLLFAFGGVLVGVKWVRQRRDAELGPPLAFAWATLLGLALLQLIRLGTYMVDVSRASLSVLPFDQMYPTHSCFAAYFEAARKVSSVANIYDQSLYDGNIGPLFLDPYLYPPPFLLAPRAALLLSTDFFVLRALWFFLDAAVLVGAMVLVARWIGKREGAVAELLVPLVWIAPPVLLTLQIGNFQLVTIALAVLAMIAFHRERHALGGVLLAFVTLSKLFPGLLVLYLLLERRWRPVIWTAAMGLGWLALSLAVLGRAPFDAFVHQHLPDLASGDAFPMLWASAKAVAQNQSVYGIPLKLGVLGLPGMGRGLASAAAWIYLPLILVAAVLLARRARGAERIEQVEIWLSLLFLGSLRSPFAPGVYVQFVPLWLLTLVAAQQGLRRDVAIRVGLAWAALAIATPYAFDLSARAMVAIDAIPQLTELALVAWIVRRLLTRTAVASASP